MDNKNDQLRQKFKDLLEQKSALDLAKTSLTVILTKTC